MCNAAVIKAKPNCASYVYRKSITSNNVLQMRKEQWCMDFDCYITDSEFLDHFKSVWCVTNVPKLRSFQYRLLHRALILNSHLYRWGLMNTNLCSFCKSEKETIVHLFWNCEIVQELWQNVRNLNSVYSNVTLSLSTKNVIFNRVHNSKKNIGNFLCLLTKQYIYKQRCLNKCLNFNELKNYVIRIENIEKYIAIKNCNQTAHTLKWQKVDACPNASINDYVNEYVENM